VQKEGKLFDI